MLRIRHLSVGQSSDGLHIPVNLTSYLRSFASLACNSAGDMDAMVARLLLSRLSDEFAPEAKTLIPLLLPTRGGDDVTEP